MSLPVPVSHLMLSLGSKRAKVKLYINEKVLNNNQDYNKVSKLLSLSREDASHYIYHGVRLEYIKKENDTERKHQSLNYNTPAEIYFGKKEKLSLTNSRFLS